MSSFYHCMSFNSHLTQIHGMKQCGQGCIDVGNHGDIVYGENDVVDIVNVVGGQVVKCV